MSSEFRAEMPEVVDRSVWLEQVTELRKREKAHTREGDAIAAARRRLPMVEVDPTSPLVGPSGTLTLLEAFEGRKQLFASYTMWHTGRDAAGQCEGCTFNNAHVMELDYLHSRDVTFAVFCQGPFEASYRYREFMGWTMPWYAVPDESIERLIAGRHFGMKCCYLRDGERVFETYWTTGRGCEEMGNSYKMLDLTVYGRQETWEDSPEGWPQPFDTRQPGAAFRLNGRPIPQWSRLAAGRSDDLGSTDEQPSGGCCH